MTDQPRRPNDAALVAAIQEHMQQRAGVDDLITWADRAFHLLDVLATALAPVREICLNDAGAIDEIFLSDVRFVHLEYMDDNQVWIGITPDLSGEVVHINLTSKKRIRTTVVDDTGTMVTIAADLPVPKGKSADV